MDPSLELNHVSITHADNSHSITFSAAFLSDNYFNEQLFQFRAVKGISDMGKHV